MQVRHELWHAGIHLYEFRRHLARVRGGVADALYLGHLGNGFNQVRQIGNRAGIIHFATIGIHVLAKQCHFLHTLRSQLGNLHQNIGKRA